MSDETIVTLSLSSSRFSSLGWSFPGKCVWGYLHLQFLLTAESTPVSTPILDAHRLLLPFSVLSHLFLLVPGRSSRASRHLCPICRGSLFTGGRCAHNANTSWAPFPRFRLLYRLPPAQGPHWGPWWVFSCAPRLDGNSFLLHYSNDECTPWSR